MPTYAQLLQSGDLRTTGKSSQVVNDIFTHPEKISELFSCLSDPDRGVRMRAADALEKITHKQPQLLSPFINQLIQLAKSSNQPEVQWHIAQLFSYVPLSPSQANQAFDLLESYFHLKLLKPSH